MDNVGLKMKIQMLCGEYIVIIKMVSEFQQQ